MRMAMRSNPNTLKHILKACLIVLGSFLLTSCITKNSESASGIYFSSKEQADNRLSEFDRENPSCQLWTNWQKMCSRTGPNGKTYCVTDPDKPVRPSEPFCVQAPGSYLAFEDRSSMTQKSMLRFCAEPEKFSPDAKAEYEGCKRFKPERPFNGKRYSAFSHPWCGEWREVNTKKLVCKEDASDAKSCNRLAVQRRTLPKPAYCAAWKQKQICTIPRHTYRYRSADVLAKNENNGIVIGDLYALSTTPIAGVYCGDINYGK